MTGFASMFELDEPEFARSAAEREPKIRQERSDLNHEIARLRRNELMLCREMQELTKLIRSQNETVRELSHIVAGMRRSGDILPVLGNTGGVYEGGHIWRRQ